LDYYDPDIMSRLEALEQEEADMVAELERKRADDLENGEFSDSELDEEQESLAKQIREKKAILKIESSLKRSMNKPVMPRKFKRDFTAGGFKRHLSALGLDGSSAVAHSTAAESSEMTSGGARVRGRSKTPKLLGKRSREESGMDVDDDSADLASRFQRALTRARSSASVRSQSCFRDESVRLFIVCA
jgi:nucleolar GTP-binding protein